MPRAALALASLAVSLSATAVSTAAADDTPPPTTTPAPPTTTPAPPRPTPPSRVPVPRVVLPPDVPPAPSTFYMGMDFGAGIGEAMMFDVGADLGVRIPGSNAWGRLRLAAGGWAHLEGAGGSIVQGLVGIEGRTPGAGTRGFVGIDAGLAKLERDPYDDFGDPVPDPTAIGASVRPRVGADIGSGSGRFRVVVSTPFIYVRDEIALSVMLGVGFAVGN
jgi:hypothetical protein